MNHIPFLARPLGCLLAMVCPLTAFGQTTAPDEPSSVPAGDLIPRDTLQKMYQSELGGKFNPADADKYYAVHQLIEEYFTASSSQHRQGIVKQIDDAGLDANVVGPITRLRMNWPALTGGVYYINEIFGPHHVRYFLGIPKNYDRAVAWPLVTMLPTVQAFITIPQPDAAGVMRIYSAWILEELRTHPDAVVIMPLLNLDELWGPSYDGMNNAIQPMFHAAGRVNIDPRRVYLVGHSMSAHAVWNLALHYETFLASFNAMAGGTSEDWQRLRLINLRNVLPVVWHDLDDPLIPVDESQSLVKVLRGLKIDVDYVETKGVGHAPTPAIIAQEYAKLRARVRDLYPKIVSLQSNRPDTLFNRNDWVQIYDELHPGRDLRVLYRHGSGHMVVYDNSCHVEANISKPNTITARTDNVDTLRFFVNDQMVDFSKPVTVIVNGHQRFSDFVKPSVDEMLKDQLFLGRGWRYYTGGIDIDMETRPGTQPSTRPAKGSIEFVMPNGETKIIEPKHNAPTSPASAPAQ